MHAGDVVEHHVGIHFWILRQPRDNLAKLVISVSGVMAPVAVQAPVNELRSQRWPNEWIDGMDQPEIPADAERQIIRPCSPRFPQEPDAFRVLDCAKEQMHRLDVLAGRPEARWTLKQNRRRVKRSRSIKGCRPRSERGCIQSKPTRFGPLSLRELAAQPAIGAARAEMRNHLPGFHRELEIRRSLRAPFLESRKRRRIVERLLDFDDAELPEVSSSSNREPAHSELHRHE